MTVRIARAYDPPGPDDGHRVLVDRVWPRGRSKEALRLDSWDRDIAPSDELRHWFGHDPARWDEFQQRYRAELSTPAMQARVDALVAIARSGTLTLVYGATDREHNQAVVLAEVIREAAG
ncbi:MAG: DUF488 domain-containing protein [Chloroflexi bacterium]|nr:DUF488 domain-containing protein [Chloroflexota bacterium]